MNGKRSLGFLAVLAGALALAACSMAPVTSEGGSSPAPADERPVLVVATHDSFAIGEETVAAFEEASGATIQFLPLGDAGAAVNKMILSKDAPLADVFYGTDNTFLTRALAGDIFVPYESPLLEQIPDELELDSEHRLLPVDVGYVSLNADAGWFEEQGIPLPATLEALTDPLYANLLVVENPATSSPGLAFLLATVAHFGEDGWQTWWTALHENGVLVTEGWSEAYYDHFTVGSSGAGDRPLVVSYTSSPPADVLYATDGRTEPASVNLNLDGGVFRQVEFVGIAQGTQQLELARQWVDFMLDTTFQEDIPLQMFVYPANENAALPELFVQFAEPPANAVSPTPEEIDVNREALIVAWTEIMLR